MDPGAAAEGAGPVDESVREVPGAALRPWAGWYSGYRQAGVPPMRHRGLPSPYLTLILTLDEPLTVLAHPDPGQTPGDFHLLLGGLHTAPALIGHEGRHSGVQVALNPLGARALLGIPAGAIAETDVAADEVLGRDIVEAQERLRAAKDWPRRFAVVDDWLLKRAAKVAETQIPAELVHAWRLLLRSRGAMPIADVAGELGWSTRRLSGRFSAEFGLTPKAAARVIRFDRARRRLVDRARGGPVDAWPDAGSRRGLGLADLAVDAGYYDQAHMDREFRALAGCPPVSWLAEEFRNVQSGATPGE